MSNPSEPTIIPLDVEEPIWDHFFTVAPLAVVGTKDESGAYDLAPKHMAMPLGWDNYYGFVCTPKHRTYPNIQRTGVFTVSFPRPDQVVLTSLTSAPRCDDDSKPILRSLPTFPASVVDGVLLRDGYLFLECKLDRIIDDFGRNSLIVGSVVAASVDERALRVTDADDQEIIASAPLLAYLPPGRYAEIDHSFSFPFPAGFKK